MSHRTLDKDRIAEIVDFCLYHKSLDALPPDDGQIICVAMNLFGISNEYFTAIDICVRMAREITRLERLDPIRPRLEPEARRRRKRAAPGQLSLDLQPPSRMRAA